MRSIIVWMLIAYAGMRFLETFWPRAKVPGFIVLPNSITFIVAAYIVVFLAVFWAMGDWVATPVSLSLTAIGWLLICLSTIGRNWAIASLGIYHSIHIEIREQQLLVRNKPYNYVRNPYYLSNFIEAIGLVLVANSLVALVLAICVYFPLLIHRLVWEETAMSQKFGSLFELYKQEVPVIVPFPIRRIAVPFTITKWKKLFLGSKS